MRLVISLLIAAVLIGSCQSPERAATTPVPSADTAPPAAAAYPPQPAVETSKPTPGPRTIIEEFGRRLDMVSTLAPAADVAKAMREQWSDLVAPELLETWIANPAASPGRTVSSPRPDRIEIENLSMSGPDHASARGTLVEVTSSGEASRQAVAVELERRHDRWFITRFSPAEPGTRAANDPAAVVREYYAAIAARDLKRAYALWGPDGRPGQSFTQFQSGFDDTATVRVKTGPPSRIEAAAGSRYIEIPVTVEATTRSGQHQHFTGTYTLRRAVVDGASPEQRRWHLYRASLHALGTR